MRRKRSVRKKRAYLVIPAIVVTLTSLSSYAFVREEHADTAAKLPSAQVYPRPYSDAHITAEAVRADPRFKDRDIVALDSSSLIANAWRSIYTGKSPAFTPQENGTWLWTPLMHITPEYRATLLQGAQERGINVIYLSLDSYLDIFVMEEGADKEARKKTFDAALEAFIKEASERGIAVDAEGGWRNWAQKDHTYKAFAVLDYAIEYNRTHEHKLRGFQYDVEPYLLDEFQTEPVAVLKDFLNLMNRSVTRLHRSDLRFTVVIPDFYDGRGMSEFFYARETRSTLEHLLHILERRPGSSIIVMSYRNFAEGDDGVLTISREEIMRANDYQTKIIIAQETGDFEPSYITFFNLSRAAYEKQIETIEKNFSQEKSFGGIATHYINTLLELQ